MPYRSILRLRQNHPDMGGPLRTLAMTSRCCSAARHCGHLFIVQHSIKLSVGQRRGFNGSPQDTFQISLRGFDIARSFEVSR